MKKSTCSCGESGSLECRDDCTCDCGCSCCGSSQGGFTRRYQTKASRIAELEHYLQELKEEAKAVEEHLSDLKRRR